LFLNYKELIGVVSSVPFSKTQLFRVERQKRRTEQESFPYTSDTCKSKSIVPHVDVIVNIN
jgi:hypothetical protein